MSKPWKVIRAAHGGLAVVNIPEPTTPVLQEFNSHEAAFDWMEAYDLQHQRKLQIWRAVGFAFVFGAVLLVSGVGQ